MKSIRGFASFYLVAIVVVLIAVASMGYVMMQKSTSSLGTSNGSSFSASPVLGTAPLVVLFSGSADITHINYGDNSSCGGEVPDVPPGVSPPPACRDDTGELIFHTFAKPGIYEVMASRSLPSTLIGKLTITVY